MSFGRIHVNIHYSVVMMFYINRLNIVLVIIAKIVEVSSEG